MLCLAEIANMNKFVCMKKIIFSILLFPCLYPAQAQDASNGQLADRRLIDRVSGNPLYVYQYEDVKGSAFLFDNWTPGTVILQNHVTFENVPLKFDVKSNEFIFNRNDSSFQLGPDAIEIKLYPNGGDSLVFKNGFEINAAVHTSKYLQELVTGKLTFLKFLKKNIEEYSIYGDATKYKRFVELYDYFIYKDGKADPVRINKKELQRLFPDKWDIISRYLSQNNFSGKDEKSFVAAIRYYNSL
jgi:hypothetical protein